MMREERRARNRIFSYFEIATQAKVSCVFSVFVAIIGYINFVFTCFAVCFILLAWMHHLIRYFFSLYKEPVRHPGLNDDSLTKTIFDPLILFQHKTFGITLCLTTTHKRQT